MRVLVTGARGQLGSDMIILLEAEGFECCGVSFQDFDLTDMAYTSRFIRTYAPDVVIHCAAYTNVDMAEDEPDKCTRVNVKMTTNITGVCKEINAKLVYISTDYVFFGDSDTPHEADSETDPHSVYGRTKAEGEKEVRRRLQRHFIVRTSWMFGVNGNNFVNTMLRLGAEQSEVNVVSDQLGSPTYTEDLVALILSMIQTDKYGTYHATNEGYCSWADFAVEIFRQSGLDTKVNFIHSSEYPSRAERPNNSRMSKKSLDDAGFERLPHWRDALRRYLRKIGNLHS